MKEDTCNHDISYQTRSEPGTGFEIIARHFSVVGCCASAAISSITQSVPCRFGTGSPEPLPATTADTADDPIMSGSATDRLAHHQ